MRIAREFILIPIILLIFTFLVSDAYGFVYGKLASVLFPTDNSPLQISKIYFTATFGFMILEYFISSRMPNNYFFSRMLGMLTMMILVLLFSNSYNLATLNHLLIILAGSAVSYFTQLIPEIKFQNFMGLFLLSAVLVFLIVISF
jgi:hypothetical protein